jgi:hypothetical protein
MDDLHVLAQRVPDPDYLAGLERHEVLLQLSNKETQKVLEAMLAQILGRPLLLERSHPDLNGGTMLNMILVSLTDLSVFAPDVFPDWLREKAIIFTADFMRIVKAVSCPGETIAEHIGEFIRIYELTRDVYNPWVQFITIDLVRRLCELQELTPSNEIIVHELIMMRKRLVSPLLASKLAPLTARAIQRLEAQLVTVTNPEEHAAMASRVYLYNGRLAFYICVAVDEP